MKRKCAMLLCIVLALSVCFPMSAAAAPNQYGLSELGLEVTVPEGYIVITRDMPADDPIFPILGTTHTAFMEQLEASHIYLNAVSDNSYEEIVVTMIENSIDNLSLFSDTSLSAFASTIVNQFSGYGYDIMDYTIYQHSQAKFIKLYFTDAEKTVYGLQYYTIYDGKAMNFTMRSYEGSISARQEAAIKTVVDSILFDNPPPVTEQGEDTRPFQYTDADTGVTFLVPENWKQKEFSKPREIIDAKFVSTKEAGCLMIYGSADIWEEMTAAERKGHTRSELDNSFFDRLDIAQMYGTTFDKISTVKYNGIEYYKGEVTASSDEYGLDIAMTMTVLTHIKDGWMYLFQFSGTSADALYSEFETLMKSVIYPPVSGEEDPAPTNQTTLPTYPSKQHSHNASENAAPNHTGVMPAVVLLVIVSAIIVAVIATCKKNRKTREQAGHAPEMQPVSDPQQICFCRKCGQKLPSDSAFCHICGTKVVKEE